MEIIAKEIIETITLSIAGIVGMTMELLLIVPIGIIMWAIAIYFIALIVKEIVSWFRE